MSMNNFYGNSYYNPYQQSVMYPQNNPYQQQQMNRPQIQQLTFVSGIEGAKAYIVPPSQTIYLKDSDSDLLWVKSADMQGKYYMQCFKLVEYNNTSNNENNNNNGNIDYLPMASFNAFKSDFEERLSKLSSQVENVLKQGSIVRKNDNSSKGGVNRNE